MDNILINMTQNKLDEGYKLHEEPEVSPRTGNQYMMRSHKVILKYESVRDNYSMFESHFKETYAA